MTPAPIGGVPGRMVAVALDLADRLGRTFTEPATFRWVFGRLGWDVETIPSEYLSVGGQAQDLVAEIRGWSDPPGLPEIVQLAGDVAALWQDIAALGATPPGVDAAAFRSDLASALPDLLLTEVLADQLPGLLELAESVGAVAVDDMPASGNQARHLRSRLDSAALGNALADPKAALLAATGWGQDGAPAARLAEGLLGSLGLPVAGRRTKPEEFDAAGTVYGLQLVESWTDAGAAVELGADVIALGSGADSSIEVRPRWSAELGASLDLGGGWSLALTAEADPATPPGLVFGPEGVSAALPDGAPGGTVSADLRCTPETPWVLFGASTGTRLELAEVGVGLALEFEPEPELRATLDLSTLALVVGGGDADSFVATVLGDSEQRYEADTTLSYGTSSGFSAGGPTGVSLVLPLYLTLGPVTVERLSLSLGADPTALLVGTATADVAGDVGLVAARVDGIGVRTALTEGGDASLPALDVGFVPPRGIGIELDVGVASGGGYLYVGPSTYEGVIDLDVLAVRIAAVVIVDTDPPGVDGWSMFFALFLDLPSIQLGFGFTLLGVGGLAGINRGIDVDALESAVRSGSLDTVLFPEDPIADAPVVIAELGALFPPADDSYVFGPVVKIGWGTPTLIEAELGIVIQLPDPIVIVVLGSVSALLPTKEVELVALNLDVAGVIDFEAGTLSIDASLHHSHVVGFALAGDMSLRADFGNARSFLMSVGGFHPRFDPPGDFPSLARLSFGISAGSILRVEFEAYFALTSNTVQFGSQFELEAEVLGFGVEGGAGFDALVQFSPFLVMTSVNFEVTIVAVGVDLAGVMLHASVEGPNRWHVIGTATFKVLGLEKSIRVDEIIGDKTTEPPVEAPDLVGDLVAALSRDDAWQVIPVAGAGVTLTEQEDLPPGELVATPNSLLGVAQRLVPLGIELEKYGDAPVGTDRLFDLAASEAVSATQPIEDWFAPAQFLELAAAERLEGPSFEEMRAGIEFGAGAPATGPSRYVNTNYVQYVIDPELPEEEDAPTSPVRGVPSYVEGLAVGAAPEGRTSRGFTVSDASVVDVASPQYAVLDDDANVVATTATWTEARALEAAGR